MKYLDYSGLQYYDEKLKGYIQSSLDDLKSEVQYSLPVATETALGGIKSGIYIEVNTNGQILQPGSYFGSFPGDACNNFNGKFSDWGYYDVSESATNGPEGEDLSAAGLHCRLISIRSGNVKYIEQILYLYNKDYFYTRQGRLDADGNWTNGGNWVKHADTSSAGSVASYGVLGSVKGRDVYANNDYTAMLGGITFDNGVIVANKSFIGRPLATAYVVENGLEDGPVDKVAGTIIITPDSGYAEVLTENETGTEGNRDSVDISQLSPILLHNLQSQNVAVDTTPVVDFINPTGHKIYVVNRGTTAQRPTNLTNAHVGIQYYDTDLNKVMWWNGSSWDTIEEYTLPTASTTQLGGVKVGDGLEITQEGVLNCIIDPGSGTVSWGNISGKPAFATVATTGSYNDLTDTPNIEVASEQEIDALFI